MATFFNKKYSHRIKELLNEKNLNNNRKIFVRPGTNALTFIDNYSNIKNLNIVENTGSVFKMATLLIKTSRYIKNYNFFIITKNKPKDYLLIDFILYLKQTNNFILLKPTRGGFKVYSNGLSGIVPKIELKKILFLNNNILKFLLLNIFFKKFLVLRLPTTISKYNLTIRRRKLKLYKIVFFKFINKKKYEKKRNFKKVRMRYFKKTVKFNRTVYSNQQSK